VEGNFQNGNLPLGVRQRTQCGMSDCQSQVKIKVEREPSVAAEGVLFSDPLHLRPDTEV
jgi:hypothetical protein